MDPDDVKEQSFTIQVLGRSYHLRADSRTVCKDWVITLNRIKEAKMQQGHIHLVHPHERHVNNEEMVAPRVVVVANRGRTRAVAETEDFAQLIRIDSNTDGEGGEHYETSLDSNGQQQYRRSTIGNAVLARWTKRRSSLSRLSAKLSRWARSLRQNTCTNDTSAISNSGTTTTTTSRFGSSSTQPSNDPRLAGWINKEASRSGAAAPSDVMIVKTMGDRSQSMASSDDDRRCIS